MFEIMQSYSNASQGARALAAELNLRLVRHKASRYRYRGGLVLNWGCGRSFINGLDSRSVRWFNSPHSVNNASDKLTAYRLMEDQGVRVPPWSDVPGIADEWLEEGRVVVCRHEVRGHSGAGIELIDPATADRVPLAPLYTLYVKKIDEYRVHTTGSGSREVFVQQKRARTEVPREQRNYQVRNHDNGFVYCTEGVDAPEAVITEAQWAVDALELDYGAVDIGWSMGRGEATVYEVNTAPGLKGSTPERIARMIAGGE